MDQDAFRALRPEDLLRGVLLRMHSGLWASLPAEIKDSDTLTNFKQKINH